jgi:hypothetical protein
VFLQVENYDLQEGFLTKPNSILTRKQILDAATSNTDGFLSRGTCASTTQLNRPIGSTVSLSHLENSDMQEVCLSKTNSILTGKPCA